MCGDGQAEKTEASEHDDWGIGRDELAHQVLGPRRKWSDTGAGGHQGRAAAERQSEGQDRPQSKAGHDGLPSDT